MLLFAVWVFMMGWDVLAHSHCAALSGTPAEVLPAHLPYVRILGMKEIRVTAAVAAVLRVFLEDPAKARHGFELMKVTSFPSGKLYPILARLAQAGWLKREREDIDPAAAGRPVRYMYQINPNCVEKARQELAELSQLHPAARPAGRLVPRERPA